MNTMTADPICSFQYHAPNSMDEVKALLHTYGPEAKLIAGGTDLIPKMKAGVVRFGHLVSLKNLEELRVSCYDAQGALHIGANTTLRELEAMEGVKETFPALWQGMHSMASTQIRNRSTVTGNICNAVPSADTAPALLVYEAVVVITSVSGTRQVPISEFFTGVCRTVLQPDELVQEIIVPKPAEDSRSIYYKYAIRNALDLAMIGVAANVLLRDGVVKDAKLALGAVAAAPRRAAKAEAILLGRTLTEERIEEAARVASQEDCAPISDIRASADYRREMVRIHVRDALRFAMEKGEAQ